MATKTRLVCGVLCCLGVALLAALGRTSRRWPEGESAVTAADCRQCHASVWREWESSYHAKAWSDDQVQAAFQHFGVDRKCQSCHAPQAGLSRPGDVMEVRAENREAGVHCLNCHGLAGGGVAAARTLADAPCKPQATPLLSSSEACGACHEAIYEDWQASRYRQENKSCQSCHMPAAPDDKSRRSHLCSGSHDDDLIRSGAKLECRQEGDELTVSVTNHATGHNFPGERHNRVLFVQVIQRTAEGRITLAKQATIKGITPFRGESSREQIRVDQTFRAKFPIVNPPVVADVQLLYKAFPWHADEKALVVHRQTLNLGLAERDSRRDPVASPRPQHRRQSQSLE